jgi:hypothetical protein
MRLRLIVLSIALASSTHVLFSQTCGGKERWAAKDGTDALAAQIDLSNIMPLTIHDLITIQQPQN